MAGIFFNEIQKHNKAISFGGKDKIFLKSEETFLCLVNPLNFSETIFANTFILVHFWIWENWIAFIPQDGPGPSDFPNCEWSYQGFLGSYPGTLSRIFPYEKFNGTMPKTFPPTWKNIVSFKCYVFDVFWQAGWRAGIGWLKDRIFFHIIARSASTFSEWIFPRWVFLSPRGVKVFLWAPLFSLLSSSLFFRTF